MEKEIDVWELIQLGLFEEACLKADKDFVNKGSLTILRNKAYALFNLEKYEEVVILEHDIIDRDGKSAGDLIFLGIALWILNKKDEAIENWRKGEDAIYQDASGGLDVFLLLYFASVRLSDEKLKKEAIKKIKKISKNKRNVNWPGPLAHYVLDEMKVEEILIYIDNDIPIIRERQLCQMDFVVAMKLLEFGDKIGYFKKLNDCVSYGNDSYLQKFLYLARGELRELNSDG